MSNEKDVAVESKDPLTLAHECGMAEAQQRFDAKIAAVERLLEKFNRIAPTKNWGLSCNDERIGAIIGIKECLKILRGE